MDIFDSQKMGLILPTQVDPSPLRQYPSIQSSHLSPLYAEESQVQTPEESEHADEPKVPTVLQAQSLKRPIKNDCMFDTQKMGLILPTQVDPSPLRQYPDTQSSHCVPEYPLLESQVHCPVVSEQDVEPPLVPIVLQEQSVNKHINNGSP